jgi:ABC-2 type transport system permease protein
MKHMADKYIMHFAHYFRVWLLMSRNSFMGYIMQKKLFFLFFAGKVIRFFLFLVFLIFLVRGAGRLLDYDTTQVVFFFLTFNLIDVVSQFFFREVYRFRSLLVSGDFDLILVKPYNALFRVLMGGADIIDLVTIPPLTVALIWVGTALNPTFLQAIVYLALVINGLLIATAFHIFVLAMAIVTLEIDHSIMIYRDITGLGRFPVDIYKEPVRSVLTYFIPVGIMITLPAKYLVGTVSFKFVVFSFIFGAFLFYLSKKIWSLSIKKYTSASS